MQSAENCRTIPALFRARSRRVVPQSVFPIARLVQIDCTRCAPPGEVDLTAPSRTRGSRRREFRLDR
jgi:hypothetical protein